MKKFLSVVLVMALLVLQVNVCNAQLPAGQTAIDVTLTATPPTATGTPILDSSGCECKATIGSAPNGCGGSYKNESDCSFKNYTECIKQGYTKCICTRGILPSHSCEPQK